MKKIVIVGATSRIAHMCARLWADEDCEELVLVGRNQSKLDVVRDDIKTRNQRINCETRTVNFLETSEIKNCVDSICLSRVPDIVLIAQGTSLPENEELRQNIKLEEKSIRINYMSVVLFLEAFAGYLETTGSGNLAVIGSVAGDRGRNSNYIYGASKAAIETYVEGLRHHFALNKANVYLTLIKPGPTKSPLTEKMNQSNLASPENVAKHIVNSINNNKTLLYAPLKWKIIMFIIRLLPNNIFNRINI